jgi:type IV pilus assembly protein PilX
MKRMTTHFKSFAAMRSTKAATHREQRGVVMFVALVVLIVMTLAGLAMLRQMSSGTSIAGNIAFKQGTTAVADAGIEAGRAWLGANPGLLENNKADQGYYATWVVADVNPTSAAWKAMWDASPDVLATSAGTVKYVIQRLCSQAGPSFGGAQQCSDSIPASVGGESKGGGDGYGGGGGFKNLPTPFYRVTARVAGPRNTVSYTQVVLN